MLFAIILLTIVCHCFGDISFIKNFKVVIDKDTYVEYDGENERAIVIDKEGGVVYYCDIDGVIKSYWKSKGDINCRFSPLNSCGMFGFIANQSPVIGPIFGNMSMISKQVLKSNCTYNGDIIECFLWEKNTDFWFPEYLCISWKVLNLGMNNFGINEYFPIMYSKAYGYDKSRGGDFLDENECGNVEELHHYVLLDTVGPSAKDIDDWIQNNCPNLNN